MRAAFAPTSLFPTRDLERMSTTALSAPRGVTRMTTSSLKPNHAVVAVASMRPPPLAPSRPPPPRQCPALDPQPRTPLAPPPPVAVALRAGDEQLSVRARAVAARSARAA